MRKFTKCYKMIEPIAGSIIGKHDFYKKLLHIKIQPRLKTITEVIAMCKLVQSVK